MSEEKGVKLFGMWASGFSLRVEWALSLKGVEYEYINEDLPYKKSSELLHYNPITKKVPTLVHDSRAIAESLVILEYIDEAWTDGQSIMPKDPHERAQARFWARFADDKCLPTILAVYRTTGEEQEKAVRETQEALKTLEKALEGKKFVGGENIGYLDIVVGWFAYWLPMIEEIAYLHLHAHVSNNCCPLSYRVLSNLPSIPVTAQPPPPPTSTPLRPRPIDAATSTITTQQRLQHLKQRCPAFLGVTGGGGNGGSGSGSSFKFQHISTCTVNV